VLTKALDSVAVTGTAVAAPPKTYSDPDGTFSLTCDRRFIFTQVAEEVEVLEQPLGLADPLAGWMPTGSSSMAWWWRFRTWA
jgi:hypothetical protein